MACTEFTNALAWAQKTTDTEKFPVRVYFTMHFGFGPTANSFGSKDAVHYAHGNVFAYETPTPHLKGTLNAARNIEGPEMMGVNPNLTYDVQIFPDGTVIYSMKNKGLPPITKTVQAACVNGVLLTAASGSEVVTLGLAQKPSYTDDVPK